MISHTHDSISINLDCVLHPYYLNSNFEFLLPVLYSLKQDLNDKTVYVIAEMQTPINIQPFYSVITTIAKTLDIPKTQIILYTKYRDFDHPDVTVKVVDNKKYYDFPRQVVAKTLGCNFEYEKNPVMFGGLYGRPSYPRVAIAKHLEIEYPTQSFVTFHGSKEHFYHNILELEEYFSEEIKWFENRKNFTSVNADNHLGSVNFPTNIETWPEIWGKYLIEISIETNYTDKWEQTEKTWKCLASGKPFLLFAGAGSLEVIRALGFKTFAPFINENYDNESNTWKRLDMIKFEIDRLASLEQAEKKCVLDNIQLIAARNKEIAKQYV